MATDGADRAATDPTRTPHMALLAKVKSMEQALKAADAPGKAEKLRSLMVMRVRIQGMADEAAARFSMVKDRHLRAWDALHGLSDEVATRLEGFGRLAEDWVGSEACSDSDSDEEVERHDHVEECARARYEEQECARARYEEQECARARYEQECARARYEEEEYEQECARARYEQERTRARYEQERTRARYEEERARAQYEQERARARYEHAARYAEAKCARARYEQEEAARARYEQEEAARARYAEEEAARARFEQEEAARHAEVPSAYFRGSAPAARAPVDRPVYRTPAAHAGLREHREQQPVAPAAFRGVPLCGAPVAPATFRGPLGPRPRGQEAQATVESAYLPPFDRFAGSEPCFAPLDACIAPLDAPAGAAEPEPESPQIRTPSPQWASLEAGGINLSFPMIGEASRPVALPAADAFSPLGAWVDAC